MKIVDNRKIEWYKNMIISHKIQVLRSSALIAGYIVSRMINDRGSFTPWNDIEIWIKLQ